MEVLEIISSKMEMAQHFLDDLLSNYDRLDDTARIDRANVVFDNITSYLQIEQNLLFPYIRKTGEHDDILEQALAVHDRIDEEMEKSVMVHVDEPDHQFYHGLDTIRGLLERAKRIDQEMIFPWARVYLSEEDHYALLNPLKEQTAHETVAPLAWQQAMFREKGG
ncbi:MAG TPA: hypothetical protein V6C99_03400 [Oculatellaceae cyanobacterium]|jgi:hypothetical protein